MCKIDPQTSPGARGMLLDKGLAFGTEHFEVILQTNGGEETVRLPSDPSAVWYYVQDELRKLVPFHTLCRNQM